MTFDPLAAQGLLHALFTGLAAAVVADAASRVMATRCPDTGS